MGIVQSSTCIPGHDVPLLHFHGTEDEVVPYQGSFGVNSVDATMERWKFLNQTDSFMDSYLTDTDSSDSSNVYLIVYLKGSQELVRLYRIINGGHTWPGAVPLPVLGHTNQDINASQLMLKFFLNYCEAQSARISDFDLGEFSVWPNPANKSLHVANFSGQLLIVNSLGVPCLQTQLPLELIDLSQMAPGLYILLFSNDTGIYIRRLIIDEM
jgi:polyhydroxybutyrate depolymerase